jgi:hypothetical protein
VQPEEFLPTPLRLRREIERLAEAVGELRSEDDVEVGPEYEERGHGASDLLVAGSA